MVAHCGNYDLCNSAEPHATAAIGRVQQRLSIFPRGRDGIARRMSQIFLVTGREFAYDQMPESVVAPTEGESLAIRGDRRIDPAWDEIPMAVESPVASRAALGITMNRHHSRAGPAGSRDHIPVGGDAHIQMG